MSEYKEFCEKGNIFVDNIPLNCYRLVGCLDYAPLTVIFSHHLKYIHVKFSFVQNTLLPIAVYE